MKKCSFIKITQLQKFAKEDLIKWLTEPVVYGDPVMNGEEAKEPNEPPVTLFTSAAFTPTSAIRQGSPASTHKPYERPSTSSNYNRPRAPINPTPRPTVNPTPRPTVNTTPRLPISCTPRSSVGPSHNSAGQSSRPPTSNSFSYKSPSAVFSTPRPAPYVQPNRSLPAPGAIPTTSAQAQKSGNTADDNFLSQFLQGVDTDSLFDDF